MHSKRILIFPQCITDFNVPLKGKGFTKGAGEIFPEVHLSLEQLVSSDPVYREWRKGVTIGNRCSESPQRSLFSLFTIESPGKLNFPVKLISCRAALMTHGLQINYPGAAHPYFAMSYSSNTFENVDPQANKEIKKQVAICYL